MYETKMPWHRALAIRDMIESWRPEKGITVIVGIPANQPCAHVAVSLTHDSSGHAIGVVIQAGGDASLSSIYTAMDGSQIALKAVVQSCSFCSQNNGSSPCHASSSTRHTLAASLN